MELNLDKLNKEQRKAVVYGEGPLLIVAGAGTGKTTVLTQRIAYLIEKGKVKPEEILAVTFTEKAASEMEERVDQILPYGYVDLWISTFHAFCERILKDHALDIGLSNDFKLLNPTASWLLIRQNLDKFNLDYYKPRGNPTRFIHALISHFSRCKDQGIYPEDYLKYCENLKTNLTDLPENQEVEKNKEVANTYHIYQRLLLENNILDFGDLINYCLKLFRERPAILKKYRDKFKYILVDEFQDTNYTQYELIKTLSALHNNLTVSADDDQAIYRWRGASFNNIVRFKKDFPEIKEIFLIENYRSTQDILDLSYKFIKANNPNRLECVSKIDKKLIANKKGKGVVKHLHFKSLDEEVRGVISRIIEISKKDKESDFSDFAILVRSNNSANPFIRALERANLPYQFLASSGLYFKPVILDIISYLKLLDNYNESSAVYRVLNLQFLEVPSDEIMKITQHCRVKAKSIYEALQELPLISGLSQKTVNDVNFLLGLIKKHTELARERNTSEVLVAFLKDSGYLKHLIDGEDKHRLELVNQFYKKVMDFEESAMDPTLKSFMRQLNLELESGEQGKLKFEFEQGPDMVRVMTIHSSKGLEFKYVFLVNLVDRRFPVANRKEPIEIPKELIKEVTPKGDVYLEEERRICYVAMTRAKEQLFLTSAEDYGGSRKKKLSRFLVEMGFDRKGESGDRKSILATKKNSKKVKIQKIVLPPHFSFSQLAAFEKCPLQYKFTHILRIPVRGRPVFSFGKTMHNTLYEFMKMVNSENNVSQTGLFKSSKNHDIKDNKVLSFKDLIGIYEKQWIDEWYEDRKQKEEYHKLGKRVLKDFYSKFQKNPPEILRVKGEIGLELPFKFKIGKHTVKGRIDRIDKTKDGIEIIDYKTGKFKEKLSRENRQQLLIYQIAAEEALGIEPLKLSYYYLEEGKKTSFLGNEEDKKKLKEEILLEIKKIGKSNFEPTPGWDCQFCDFKDICDYSKKR